MIAHLREVGDAEHEADGVQDVGLAGAVQARDGVEEGVERGDNGPLRVGLEPLDAHLLDVHGKVPTRVTARSVRVCGRRVTVGASRGWMWRGGRRARGSNRGPRGGWISRRCRFFRRAKPPHTRVVGGWPFQRSNSSSARSWAKWECFPREVVASARPRYDVAGGALVPAPCRRRRRRGRRGGPRETRAFDGGILARLARLAWFRHARLVAGDAARAAVTSPPAVSGTTASTEAADAAAATTTAADATTATTTTTAILPAHHRGPSSRSPPRPPETRPRGR